ELDTTLGKQCPKASQARSGCPAGLARRSSRQGEPEMTHANSRGLRLTRRSALMMGAGVAVSASNLVWAQAQGQNLTIGVRAGPDSMDPHFTATGTHAEALKHIFDKLVWSGDRLQIEPCLAESWSQPNPTTWEFKLRRSVKFHDGSEMTAEDVKFSIERMKTLSGPNPTTIYVRRVDRVEIVDPYTVRVVTQGPSPTL